MNYVRNSVVAQSRDEALKISDVTGNEMHLFDLVWLQDQLQAPPVLFEIVDPNLGVTLQQLPGNPRPDATVTTRDQNAQSRPSCKNVCDYAVRIGSVTQAFWS